MFSSERNEFFDLLTNSAAIYTLRNAGGHSRNATMQSFEENTPVVIKSRLFILEQSSRAKNLQWTTLPYIHERCGDFTQRMTAAKIIFLVSKVEIPSRNTTILAVKFQNE